MIYWFRTFYYWFVRHLNISHFRLIDLRKWSDVSCISLNNPVFIVCVFFNSWVSILAVFFLLEKESKTLQTDITNEGQINVFQYLMLELSMLQSWEESTASYLHFDTTLFLLSDHQLLRNGWIAQKSFGTDKAFGQNWLSWNCGHDHQRRGLKVSALDDDILSNRI